MADAPARDLRAAAFVAARRGAQALPVYPGAYPATEAEAYAVQADAIALWPDSVAGWKVGLIQPPFAAALGRSRLFGPIFARHVVVAGEGPSAFPCIPNGFAAVEAEYVLQLGADVPPSEGWTADRAAPLVSAVHIGVEFAGSPFPGINDHGPLVTISDFGNNAGLVLGPPLAGLAALEGHRCAMWIDGEKIADGGAHTIPGGPLGSLVELLNHNGRMGGTLPAGTLVSTGAATGVHAVRIGQSAVADFGADGRIAMAMQEASA
ncbi:2-keto-4-pentenoate hydratase [Sandaracinobacter neustonicus]|uniref:2-keto-4-pentenoate hydratase n=1 Tax=Sandaracinobacter neustonicus TaxID=1715348 RepID=A0A501XIW0_9SPHN|nr:2-keto-4-pentenoate hydratase [Sandaracinobacter neustonicus]TPE60591.1 2-keto-4-pentenoate hydratase [Sandaracinobacter neustonicus]